MFCMVAMFCRSGPWGLKPEDPCFTNTYICPGGSPHQGCRHSLGVCKEAQVLQGNTCILKRETFQKKKKKKRNISYPTRSTLFPRCPGGEPTGQFITLVRTRRQLNTSHAARRFKTLRDVLHTCYIATFGVLAFIVPPGHKNVLVFIECTESETPPLANPPKLEGTLIRLGVLDLSLKCDPAPQQFGQSQGTSQAEGLLLSSHNPKSLPRDPGTEGPNSS